MSFAGIAEFFAMGGHGIYVWLCYSVSALVVLANVWIVHRQRQQTFRELVAQRRRAD